MQIFNKKSPMNIQIISRTSDQTSMETDIYDNSREKVIKNGAIEITPKTEIQEYIYEHQTSILESIFM